MNFANLKEFLLNKMSMSHIYQPVLIRALIDLGVCNVATTALSNETPDARY
jgi:hypothetical protein